MYPPTPRARQVWWSRRAISIPMTPQLPFSLARPAIAPVEGLTVVSASKRWINPAISATPHPICEFLNGSGATSGVTPDPFSWAVRSTVPGAGSIDGMSEVSTPCARASPAAQRTHPKAARWAAQATHPIPNFPRVGDMLNPVEKETVLQHDLEQAVDKLFGREHRQPQR